MTPTPRKPTLAVEAVATPLGGLLVVVDAEGAVRAVEFADCEARMRRLLDRRLGQGGYRLRAGSSGGTAGALASYFAGDLDALSGVAVSDGGTPFQRRVWAALRALPPGTRQSYGEMARALGLPAGTARAVGAANGANPVSIIVPCHRLVAAGGGLAGYGGGVARKRWLLAHEAAAQC